MKKFMFFALLAASIGSGLAVFNAQKQDAKINTLALANVEALTVVDPVFCEWMIVLDTNGCKIHVCVKGGDGFICQCGEVMR